MRLQGIVELSTVDWPGRPCTVVFFQGCNLRCPWCQNTEGVEVSGGKESTVDEITAVLKVVSPLADSVMLSGGEPLLQLGACMETAKTARALGFKVGIETNGTLPENLREMLPFLDFVAIDVKAPLTSEELYHRAVGLRVEGITEKIAESLRLLRNSGVPFEVRTTVVPTLNSTPSIIEAIAECLEGLAETICLQQFRNRVTLDPTFQKVQEPDRDCLLELAKLVKKRIPRVRIFTSQGGFEEVT